MDLHVHVVSCWQLISPEDLFQLLDLVIRILLGARVVEKSSCIRQRSCIHLREGVGAVSCL